MKKVLVLCTGNSCRSIIAEALLNAIEGIEAKSAGSDPKGEVHPFAKELLQQRGLWRNYRSKGIEEVGEDFDLVVTVCDNAQKACPRLPGVKSLHIPFEDPDGKGYEAFEETIQKMEALLVPKVKESLGLGKE